MNVTMYFLILTNDIWLEHMGLFMVDHFLLKIWQHHMLNHNISMAFFSVYITITEF